jgi:hypothetical protein
MNNNEDNIRQLTNSILFKVLPNHLSQHSYLKFAFETLHYPWIPSLYLQRCNVFHLLWKIYNV